jgi:hypothetical protein
VDSKPDWSTQDLWRTKLRWEQNSHCQPAIYSLNCFTVSTNCIVQSTHSEITNYSDVHETYSSYERGRFINVFIKTSYWTLLAPVIFNTHNLKLPPHMNLFLCSPFSMFCPKLRLFLWPFNQNICTYCPLYVTYIKPISSLLIQYCMSGAALSP